MANVMSLLPDEQAELANLDRQLTHAEEGTYCDRQSREGQDPFRTTAR